MCEHFIKYNKTTYKLNKNINNLLNVLTRILNVHGITQCEEHMTGRKAKALVVAFVTFKTSSTLIANVKKCGCKIPFMEQ
jgi:hypothetical protein